MAFKPYGICLTNSWRDADLTVSNSFTRVDVLIGHSMVSLEAPSSPRMSLTFCSRPGSDMRSQCSDVPRNIPARRAERLRLLQAGQNRRSEGVGAEGLEPTTSAL